MSQRTNSQVFACGFEGESHFDGYIRKFAYRSIEQRGDPLKFVLYRVFIDIARENATTGPRTYWCAFVGYINEKRPIPGFMYRDLPSHCFVHAYRLALVRTVSHVQTRIYRPVRTDSCVQTRTYRLARTRFSYRFGAIFKTPPMKIYSGVYVFVCGAGAHT